MKSYPLLACLLWTIAACCAADEPVRGAHGHYAVLTATPHERAPFASVDVRFGPREKIDGVEHLWWQLDIRSDEAHDGPLMVQVRALTRGNPLADDWKSLKFARYIVRIPGESRPLEYRDVHTGKALLPGWRDFRWFFIPHRTRGSALQRGIPETCALLGHILTLRYSGDKSAWEAWDDAKVLRLDRELLIGTGRNFKDAEGHRLPQQPEKKNYTYVPFTAEDYPIMLRAGFNFFRVKSGQEKFVRGESVFYQRSVSGDPPLAYPADLYRSNFLGTTMFMDEPTIIMVGDELIHNSLRYFSDAAALIPARVRARYEGSGSYGSYQMEKAFREAGVNFGDMRLQQHDYPAWETIFETTHYQMEGGLNGLVHEGRYQLEPFDKEVARWTGRDRQHTAEELLRYHFAYLRGGTRPFGKFWGTSIYGQCDPAISRKAVTMAYDMGARYVWFWTSDHGHHVPWPEQLDLVRHLRQHTRSHPRRSIYEDPPVLDKAIVIPYGTFPSLRNLWWVRVMDVEGKNEASLEYRRLMDGVLAAYHEAIDRGEDFDFVIDTGKPITGYRKLVRVKP